MELQKNTETSLTHCTHIQSDSDLKIQVQLYIFITTVVTIWEGMFTFLLLFFFRVHVE
jgi:hypothetical protein